MIPDTNRFVPGKGVDEDIGCLSSTSAEVEAIRDSAFATAGAAAAIAFSGEAAFSLRQARKSYLAGWA